MLDDATRSAAKDLVSRYLRALLDWHLRQRVGLRDMMSFEDEGLESPLGMTTYMERQASAADAMQDAYLAWPRLAEEFYADPNVQPDYLLHPGSREVEFEIISVEEVSGKPVVTVKLSNVIGPGVLRYALKKVRARWLIDSRSGFRPIKDNDSEHGRAGLDVSGEAGADDNLPCPTDSSRILPEAGPEPLAEPAAGLVPKETREAAVATVRRFIAGAHEWANLERQPGGLMAPPDLSSFANLVSAPPANRMQFMQDQMDAAQNAMRNSDEMWARLTSDCCVDPATDHYSGVDLPQSHDRDTEKIDEVSASGERVVVTSQVPERPEKVWRYELVKIGEDWKICRIVMETKGSQGKSVFETVNAKLDTGRRPASRPPQGTAKPRKSRRKSIQPGTFITPPPVVNVEELFPFLASRAKMTTRLHPRRARNLDPLGSKVGGAIAWPKDEPFPVDEVRGCAAIPILQLRGALT